MHGSPPRSKQNLMRALRKQGPILSDNPHYVLPERMVPMATQAVKPTAAKKKARAAPEHKAVVADRTARHFVSAHQ